MRSGTFDEPLCCLYLRRADDPQECTQALKAGRLRIDPGQRSPCSEHDPDVAAPWSRIVVRYAAVVADDAQRV